jgi:hypothetical protein
MTQAQCLAPLLKRADMCNLAHRRGTSKLAKRMTRISCRVQEELGDRSIVPSQRAFSGRIVVQKDGSRGLEASEVDRIALGGAPRFATPGSRLDHVPPQTAEHHASKNDLEVKQCRCAHLLIRSYQSDLVILPPWPPSSASPQRHPPDTAKRPTRDHIYGLRCPARPQAEIFEHDGKSRPFLPRTLLHVVVACSTTQRQSFCGSEDCACLWRSNACREGLQHAATASHRLTPPSCQCSDLRCSA